MSSRKKRDTDANDKENKTDLHTKGAVSITIGSTSGGGVTNESEGSDGLVTLNKSIYKPVSQSRYSYKDLQKNVASQNYGAQVAAQQGGGSSMPILRGDSVSLQTGVSSMKKGRAQEKRDLQDLNERFASYIEKARFLEAQNKQLSSEIESLKGSNTQDFGKIKAIYEVEINQLRNLLNETEKTKAPLEVQVYSLENEIEQIRKRMLSLEDINSQYKQTIEKQRRELGSLEGEVVELRRYRNTKTEDGTKEKEEVKSLRDEMKSLRANYDKEALAHITLSHELQSLKETLEFERQIHDTEVKELSTVAHRDTTKENQVYWQSEMGRALREIQSEYENKLTGIKQEMEASYGLQMQEIRTSKTRDNVETAHFKEENTRVKSQIQSMRSRISELEMQNAEYEHNMNRIRSEYEETQRDLELKLMSLQEQYSETQSELTSALTELQSLLDAKLGLELEIAAYSKLLEFEESRVNSNAEGSSTVSQFMSFAAGGGGSSYGGGSGGSYGGGSAGSYGGGSAGSYGGGSGGSYGGGSGGSYSVGIGGSLDGGSTITGVGYGGAFEKTTTDFQSKRMKFRRTTKGSISIAETDTAGSFIVLENIGAKEEDIGGMTLKRTIDGSADVVVYTIPENTSLDKLEKITIWANGKKTGKGRELEINEVSWRFGSNVVTTLLNDIGEEKAAHYQEVAN